MEKVKKSIINFLKNKYIWIFLLITLIFFGSMYKLEYSRCTFRMYSNPYIEEYDHYLVLGRYIVAIFWKIVNILGLSINMTYIISYLIGIISITLSIFILNNILKKHIKNDLLNIIISTGIILNCFLIDYFLYIEKGIFTLSILFATIALKFLLEFFENNKKRNIIYSFIFLCLSSFTYQGTVALYIAIATIFIVKYSDNIKKFIYNNVVTASIYGVTMGLSYLLVRIVGSQSTSRTTGALHIFESIKKVIKGMFRVLIDTYGTMPRFFFAFIFAIIFVAITYIIFKNCNSEKNNKYSKKIIFLGYIYILAGCTISSILPQLVIDTSAINLTARAIYPFASIIALSILYFCVNIKIDSKYYNNFFIIVFTVYLFVQLITFNNIICDHYTLNYLEKKEVLSIGKEIEKYENESNKKITKIVFYNDKDSKHSYEGLNAYGDINERVLKTTWCRIDILNYYLDRNFEQDYNQKEEYKNEYESSDYNLFDVNQLKFENDTLHLCIY